MFGLAGLLLGLQSDLACGGRGDFLRKALGSVPSSRSRLRRLSLSDTGISRHPDRLPSRTPLDRLGAICLAPGLGRTLDLRFPRLRGRAQAIGDVGETKSAHLIVELHELTQFAGYDPVNPVGDYDFGMLAVADIALEDAPPILPAHRVAGLTYAQDRG
jgi:hypothetical protein